MYNTMNNGITASCASLLAHKPYIAPSIAVVAMEGSIGLLAGSGETPDAPSVDTEDWADDSEML